MEWECAEQLLVKYEMALPISVMDIDIADDFIMEWECGTFSPTSQPIPVLSKPLSKRKFKKLHK